MNFKFVIILATLLLPFNLLAQSALEWQKTYGDSMGSEEPYAVRQTLDGGYIIIGFSTSNGGDVTGNHGNADVWVLKTSGIGNIEWQKSLGGSDDDWGSFIELTSDGGYIVAGVTLSNNGDVSGSHGDADAWIVKLNATGVLQWQKCLGGSGIDYASGIRQSNDGGYIIAGGSESSDGDVSGNHGGIDGWLVKLSGSGNLLWQKSLGGTMEESIYAIQTTNDGGFIMAGSSTSNNGDLTINQGEADYWIVKLNGIGSIQWQRSLGGSGYDQATSVEQTNDGGYIVAGYSESTDGDVTGNHGFSDCWILKLSSTGILQWEKSFGGQRLEQAWSIIQSNDDSYVFTGVSLSNDGDVTGQHGNGDIWVVKISNTGTLLWQKMFGGNARDHGWYIEQTSDGGFIVTGLTTSHDGDLTGEHISGDFWLLKLSGTIGINEIPDNKINLRISPNPFLSQTHIYFDSNEDVKIGVHDIQGKLVKHLNSSSLIKGSNHLVWDGTDQSSNRVSDGIYFISIQSENLFQSEKVVVLN